MIINIEKITDKTDKSGKAYKLVKADGKSYFVHNKYASLFPHLKLGELEVEVRVDGTFNNIVGVGKLIVHSGNAIQAPKPYQPYTKVARPEPNWDEINNKKEEGMMFLNAKNNAGVLLSACIKNGMTLEEALSQYEKTTEAIYAIGVEEKKEAKRADDFDFPL